MLIRQEGLGLYLILLGIYQIKEPICKKFIYILESILIYEYKQLLCRYDVQYQLYQMLDNHGEPCNASLHYSPDDCVEEQKFKVDIFLVLFCHKIKI